MSLLDVDNVEGDFVFVLLIQFVERGNLPAKGWSGITSKDEYNRSIRPKAGEFHAGGLVIGSQVKVWSQVADSQFASASDVPKELEWQDDHRNHWEFGHHRRKLHWWLLHCDQECDTEDRIHKSEACPNS